MKFNWKKVLGTTAALALGTLVAVLTSKNTDESDNWLETASDDELDNKYQEKRQEWMKNGFGGNGEKTPEMEKINEEMNRRTAEKWKNDPRRNTDPNYRRSDANRWDKD